MILLANPNDQDDLVYDTCDSFEDARRVEEIHRQRDGRMPVGAHVSASRGAHRSRLPRRSRPERSAGRFAGPHCRNLKSKRMNHPSRWLAALV